MTSLNSTKADILHRARSGRASVEALARARKRYRLRAPDGRYLHFSGNGLTETKAWAWVGPAYKLAALRRAVKLPADLVVVSA